MNESAAIEEVTREQVGKFQGNFTPMPITQRVDDSLLHVSAMFRDDPYYAVPLNEYITTYHAFKDGAVVGCQLWVNTADIIDLNGTWPSEQPPAQKDEGESLAKCANHTPTEL